MNDLLKIAYKAIDEKQGLNIEIIDFRNQSAFVDYFIIASANSNRMANAIIDNIEEKVLGAGFKVKKIYNSDSSNWYLIDLENILCHVFVGEERQLYNLEGLWKDLPKIKI